MLLRPDRLPPDHICPDFPYFFLFSSPPTFYTSRASPPSLDKFTSSAVCSISSHVIPSPDNLSPNRARSLALWKHEGKESLLLTVCSQLTHRCDDAWPISRPGASPGEWLLPLSASHRQKLYCIALHPQQSKTEQPLLSWSADVLSTSWQSGKRILCLVLQVPSR